MDNYALEQIGGFFIDLSALENKVLMSALMGAVKTPMLTLAGIGVALRLNDLAMSARFLIKPNRHYLY